MSRTTRRTAAAAASVLALGGVLASVPASATDAASSGGAKVHADVAPLNNSGASGHVYASVMGRRVQVAARIAGLAPGLPHAQHVHYGEQARHECPTFKDDTDRNFRLNVVEGVPQYGPIAVSLTTRGDTSPASGLALDRFPIASGMGTIKYGRVVTTERAVANAIVSGEGVYVVHGIDYNQNGRYDLNGAGPSELDPSGKTPAEATDPAACGVLEPTGLEN